MKRSNRQQVAIYDRMKRTGETFGQAEKSTTYESTDAFAAERRARLRAEDDAKFAAAMAVLMGSGR